MPRLATLLVSAALAPARMTVCAISDAQLQAIAQQRLSGDRSGACMALAVVEQDATARAFVCADPARHSRIGEDSAFEIGSISKTMMAALLAEWIVSGDASLDDALADWLPAGTRVPTFSGQPILLRHIVTHTSGLPAFPEAIETPDPDDPYADLSAHKLLDVLADVRLSAAPGSQYEYSNFASMLLSCAIARRAGTDFERWMKARLFDPLGMDTAHIRRVPAGVRTATGHTPDAKPAPAWHFSVDLAGVGGVRATLSDMVRYVEGLLGWRTSAISPALALAQQPVNETFAMHWMQLPVAGRTVLTHNGGTGGFSSFIAVDAQRQRGIIVLSDTYFQTDGADNVGLHLLDETFPLATPRKQVDPPPELLDALVGEYRLQGAMNVILRQREGQLFIHPEGQEEYPLYYDDNGDFFLQVAAAMLRPQPLRDGSYSFIWMQGGAMIPGVRVDSAASMLLPEHDLQAYAGDYALRPGFLLTLRVHNGQLQAQATGQGAFMLDAKGPDHFAAPAFGIEIEFRRDAQGAVESLDLHQGGKTLSGKREK